MKNSKEVISATFNAYKKDKKHVLWFLLLFLFFFFQTFISFYSRLIDHRLLSSLSIIFKISSTIATIVYIRYIWDSSHNIPFSLNRVILSSYLANITSYFIILIQLIPIYYILSKIEKIDFIISNRLQYPIYYLSCLPIYVLYKYSVIIASCLCVGGLKNLRLSVNFLRNNWSLSFLFIILYFLPSFFSSIVNIFIFTNIYKSIILSLLSTFTIIPLFSLSLIFRNYNQIDSNPT